MKVSLADGVFMAACDEDIVVLDTRYDLYSCLPETAGVLCPSLDCIEGPTVLLADLARTDFTNDGAPSLRKAIPELPTIRLVQGAVRPALADDLAVVSGMWAAWFRGPGRRPLSDLLNALPPPSQPVPDLEGIGRATAAFARLLPWDPAQGACLYRAWLLRRILHSRGHTVDWVFGVRTWPFGAHCWLQVDRFVLDDEPDRIAQYTPIMAV